MSKFVTTNFVNILLLALWPVSIFTHIYWLPESISVPAISDAGYVSIITLTFVACTFITILTLVFNTNLTSSKLTASAAAYVLAIYFLREADIHRLITAEHVTRGKFLYYAKYTALAKTFCCGCLFNPHGLYFVFINQVRSYALEQSTSLRTLGCSVIFMVYYFMYISVMR